MLEQLGLTHPVAALELDVEPLLERTDAAEAGFQAARSIWTFL